MPHIFILYGEILFFKTLGLNTDQILAELESGSGSAAVDVVFMPSESDAISDGDSDDDEDTLPKDLNHLGWGTLSQQAELITYDAVDELPDIIVGDYSQASVMNDELEQEPTVPAKPPAVNRLRRWPWLRRRRMRWSRRRSRSVSRPRGAGETQQINNTDK